MSHYLEGDGEGTVFLLYKTKKKSMLASGTNSFGEGEIEGVSESQLKVGICAAVRTENLQCLPGSKVSRFFNMKEVCQKNTFLALI